MQYDPSRPWWIPAAILAFCLTCSLTSRTWAQPPRSEARPDVLGDRQDTPVGLLRNEAAAFPGYTLVAPMNSTNTYLIDMQGRVVRTWECGSRPALSAYLLENGHLLRPGTMNASDRPQRGPGQGGEPEPEDRRRPGGGRGPGAGGRLQEFDWDGQLVWDYRFDVEGLFPHHDIERLPNGNVLMIVWDRKTADEARAAGRHPQLIGDEGLQPDAVVEIQPTGPTTGTVVWQWHLWDHLIQDHDPSKPNYGKVADHPELVDINYGEGLAAAMVNDPDGRERLRSFGDVGGGGRGGRINPDWTHVNGIDYNAQFDQIVLSVHAFSEIWIIDHSTTTAEAAGHTGGRSGKGGDLLYRWGNPVAYQKGTAADQRLFAQHDAQWISDGLPGAGHLLLFNNGTGRPDGAYSSIDELVLPVDPSGRYTRLTNGTFGPEKAVWSYRAPEGETFFSMLISGAQRLPNGNTLVCEGVTGRIFEVTEGGDKVWEFHNPAGDDDRGPGGFGRPRGGGPGGRGRFGGPPQAPQAGQLLPSFLEDVLELSPQQRQTLSELQESVDGTLADLLGAQQRKILEDLQQAREFGGAPPQPGQILSPNQQARLDLTDAQKSQLEALQTATDQQLKALLTDEQQQQLDSFQGAFGAFGRGGRGRFPGGGPGGRGGRGGFPPDGFGPPGGSGLFRAYRYAADYPGLVGKDLTPGRTLVEIARDRQQARRPSTGDSGDGRVGEDE